MKIMIIGALPSSLYNFRGDLIIELAKKHSVVSMACGATQEEINEIKLLGCSYIDYPISRNGLNPLKDITTMLAIKKAVEQERPDVVISYTIKPVVWGGIGLLLSKHKSQFFPMITGLGYAFQGGSLVRNCLSFLVKSLYRLALTNANGVIFQNQDNKQIFIDNKIVNKEKCHLVNGSGVNLNDYKIEKISTEPTFLLIARLLKEKGIREYFIAANIVKKTYPKTIFNLVGPEDPSPDAISKKELDHWCESGAINYHGSTTDVRKFIRESNVYVLPSYHEGMPRTTLEAMAMARPILTTNVPGCKETVVNGVNGWLVEKESGDALAKKMIWFLENSRDWPSMGAASRCMVEEKFDVNKVNLSILEILGIK
jgi:glycosyltransferase involved in cell wall biosynthesis